MNSNDKQLSKGEFIMKKIVSALSAVVLAVTSLGTGLKASAESIEKTTPSGIA